MATNMNVTSSDRQLSSLPLSARTRVKRFISGVLLSCQGQLNGNTPMSKFRAALEHATASLPMEGSGGEIRAAVSECFEDVLVKAAARAKKLSSGGGGSDAGSLSPSLNQQRTATATLQPVTQSNFDALHHSLPPALIVSHPYKTPSALPPPKTLLEAATFAHTHASGPCSLPADRTPFAKVLPDFVANSPSPIPVAKFADPAFLSTVASLSSSLIVQHKGHPVTLSVLALRILSALVVSDLKDPPCHVDLSSLLNLVNGCGSEDAPVFAHFLLTYHSKLSVKAPSNTTTLLGETLSFLVTLQSRAKAPRSSIPNLDMVSYSEARSIIRTWCRPMDLSPPDFDSDDDSGIENDNHDNGENEVTAPATFTIDTRAAPVADSSRASRRRKRTVSDIDEDDSEVKGKEDEDEDEDEDDTQPLGKVRSKTANDKKRGKKGGREASAKPAMKTNVGKSKKMATGKNLRGK